MDPGDRDADAPPMFSVVIPAYNAGEKVVRAVESVLRQTFTDFEVLVIDDGSTDGTTERIVALGDRVRCIRQRNAGAAAARNRGVSEARGRFVAFLDADDRWYEHKLARVAKTVLAHPDVALVHSRVDFVSARGEKLWTYRSQEYGRGNYRALLSTDFVMTSSTAVRRDLFGSLGGFDPALAPCEDWDMWIRIARGHRVLLIREALVAYEYMAGNSQTSATERWIRAHDAVIDKALAADTQLSSAQRRRIRAAVAYRKAKVLLAVGDEPTAVARLKESVSGDVFRWEAWIYLIVLRVPALRHRLPTRIQRALRLPESLRHQLQGHGNHG